MEAGGGKFTVNARDVVHEVVDGEVIAIDLGRGSYYSLSGGAADVWTILASPVSSAEIVSAFEDGPGEAELRREVDDLLGHLRDEALIVGAEVAGAGSSNGRGDAGSPNGTGAGTTFHYRPFAFEKYEDLQDYFLLDPIHEVGTAGWPGQKPG